MLSSKAGSRFNGIGNAVRLELDKISEVAASGKIGIKFHSVAVASIRCTCITSDSSPEVPRRVTSPQGLWPTVFSRLFPSDSEDVYGFMLGLLIGVIVGCLLEVGWWDLYVLWGPLTLYVGITAIRAWSLKGKFCVAMNK